MYSHPEHRQNRLSNGVVICVCERERGGGVKRECHEQYGDGARVDVSDAEDVSSWKGRTRLGFCQGMAEEDAGGHESEAFWA